jgi:hypothetical protein
MTTTATDTASLYALQAILKKMTDVDDKMNAILTIFKELEFDRKTDRKSLIENYIQFLNTPTVSGQTMFASHVADKKEP